MRIDSFLKITKLIKSRNYAKLACERGYVFINKKKVRPSKEIKQGDLIFLDFPLRSLEIKVLKIPLKRSLSKKEAREYFEILKDEKKEIL